jgi:hypothetical protein
MYTFCFEHMHLKFAKGAMTTNLSLKKSIWNIKTLNFMLIPNSLKWSFKNVPEKVIGKNYAILVFRILHCFS